MPSEDAAKKALDDEIVKGNQTRLKLVSFKTNGQSSVVDVGEHYKMEWEGEVEVMEDCLCNPGHMALQVFVLKDNVMDMAILAAARRL